VSSHPDGAAEFGRLGKLEQPGPHEGVEDDFDADPVGVLSGGLYDVFCVGGDDRGGTRSE